MMTDKQTQTYAKRGINKSIRALAKDDKPRVVKPRARRKRKTNVTAKQRTLCMWHAPDQICTSCNGGHVKADAHGFPHTTECVDRVAVKPCNKCYRPLTRDMWSDAPDCAGCRA